MATRPTLTRAVAKTKNTAKAYNDNFDAMMDFIDESIGEAKDYVDDYMPSVSGQAGKFLTTDGTDASWAVVIPVGTVFHYGYNSAPSGWLVCDGSAVSRTTYTDLFSAIGTTFGAGDESTTFNLPNLIDNPYIKGSSTIGIEVTAKAPNITGHFGIDNTTVSGAFYQYGSQSGDNQSGGSSDVKVYFDASRCSSVYKNDATTIEPNSLTLLPIIKY